MGNTVTENRFVLFNPTTYIHAYTYNIYIERERDLALPTCERKLLKSGQPHSKISVKSTKINFLVIESV